MESVRYADEFIKVFKAAGGEHVRDPVSIRGTRREACPILSGPAKRPPRRFRPYKRALSRVGIRAPGVESLIVKSYEDFDFYVGIQPKAAQ